MTLFEDIKASLRITSDAFDAEIETLIDAALFDMERAGVCPKLLVVDEETGNVDNALVRKAVIAYCKANFGYDNPEAERFDYAYNRVVIDLRNSEYNVDPKHHRRRRKPEPEPEPEPEPTPDPDPDDGESDDGAEGGA